VRDASTTPELVEIDPPALHKGDVIEIGKRDRPPSTGNTSAHKFGNGALACADGSRQNDQSNRHTCRRTVGTYA